MSTRAKLIAIASLLATISWGSAQTPTKERINLLTNPSFEDGEKGWVFSAYGKRGTVAVDTTEKHEGKSSIRI